MQADKSSIPHVDGQEPVQMPSAEHSRELKKLSDGLETTSRQAAAMLRTLAGQLVAAFDSVSGKELESANAVKLQSDVVALAKELEARSAGLAVSVRILAKDAIKREEQSQSGGKR